MKLWIALVFGFVVASAGAQAKPAPAAGSPAPAEGKPALWQAKGVHGTVYFFGTVHLMKKDAKWETPRVTAALKASDTLYLEIADLDPTTAAATMQPLIMSLGIDMEHPLSTKITADDVALLDKVAKDAGQPGEQMFEPMQPWLAYMTVSVLPAMKAGYDPSAGVDMTLQTEAKGAKKTIKGFETAADQLHFLADFPQAEQIALLHQTLADLPKSVAQMNEVEGDWARGEVEKIATIDNDELKVRYPAVYDRLLVRRNAHFADVLQGLLKGPATGTVFVAIGAGHLAGADSVLKMLEARGITITRVE